MTMDDKLYPSPPEVTAPECALWTTSPPPIYTLRVFSKTAMMVFLPYRLLPKRHDLETFVNFAWGEVSEGWWSTAGLRDFALCTLAASFVA